MLAWGRVIRKTSWGVHNHEEVVVSHSEFRRALTLSWVCVRQSRAGIEQSILWSEGADSILQRVPGQESDWGEPLQDLRASVRRMSHGYLLLCHVVS